MSAMHVLTLALLVCLVPVAILAGGAVIGLAHLGRNLVRSLVRSPQTKTHAG